MPILAISTPKSQPEITLSARPSRRHLKTLWEAMADDNAFAAYSDVFPQTARKAHAAITRGTMKLWIVCQGDHPVGWWSIHDRGHDERGLYGWVGCFFCPSSRGAPACASFPLLQALLDSYGLHRLFCAVRLSNRAAQRFASRVGFHRAGVCHQFTQFAGQWGDVVLYTLDHTDTVHLWEAAARRLLAAHVLVALGREGGQDAPDR